MAFEHRSRRAAWALLVIASLGCSGEALKHEFPPNQPLWVDPDRHPFDERPEEYFSPFGWDAANHTIFRPISRFFALDPAGEAVNVNALDEVPESSWFQNRIGLSAMSPAEVARGACQEPPLDPAGPWTVKGGKPDGANPGFLIEGPSGARYLIKFDGVVQGPRATAADVLGSRLYHAAGYNVPCNRIVYFERDILRIASDATVKDDKGHEHPLTEAHLDEVFSKALRLRDGRYRGSSSSFLPGTPLGPFKYQGTRDDDPNDVVPHEDRRELRGMRLLNAWINHFDAREQNTLSTWMDTGQGRGYVRHNLLDFGDSLGSLWEPPPLGRRLGHAHYLDFSQLATDWLTLGLIRRPWEQAEFGPSGRVFGYFDAQTFVPEKWRPGYPNPAFSRMQERDAAWMARIIARFEAGHVRAAVATADLRDALLEQELTRILLGRQARILDRYLSKLSPLALPELEATPSGVRLCLVDLLVTSARVARRARSYAHRAFIARGGELVTVELGASHAAANARVCVALPPTQTDPPTYLILDTIAKTAGSEPQPPARVHLWKLGPTRYRIVGLVRPDTAAPPD